MGAVSDASGGQAARRWSGTWWLTSHWLRRRWLAVVPAALVLAVGTVGAALAFSTAQRTSSAYEDYLDRADVGDLVINASRNTREIDEAIRTLPGVEQVTSDALYFVSGDEGEPRRRDSVEEGTEFVAPRGSADGRYLDMDRPIVQSGRLPTGPNEAAVTVEMAERFGIADRRRATAVVLASAPGPGRGRALRRPEVGDRLAHRCRAPHRRRHRDAAQRSAPRRALPASDGHLLARCGRPLRLPTSDAPAAVELRRLPRHPVPRRLRHPVPLLLAVVHRRRGRCRAGARGVRPSSERAQRTDGELARPG